MSLLLPSWTAGVLRPGTALLPEPYPVPRTKMDLARVCSENGGFMARTGLFVLLSHVFADIVAHSLIAIIFSLRMPALIPCHNQAQGN